MKTQVFVTGATGNIGSRLVIEMLRMQRYDRMVLLVRGASDAAARSRALPILARAAAGDFPGEWAEKVTVLAGDVRCSGFGLSHTQFQALARRTSHIIHSAASTSFAQSYHEAHATNYAGAVSIVALAGRCRELGHLANVVHVSTAYVNSPRHEAIDEDHLDSLPPAVNGYDVSKWEAEQLFRTHALQLPVALFRPSIVVGDSETGYTSAFNVLYVPLQAIAAGLVDSLPGAGNTPLDIVPVDYVARAMEAIMPNPKSRGKTFHLVAGPERALTCAQVVARLQARLARNGLPVRPIKFSDGLPVTSSRRELLLQVFQPYMSQHWVFDDMNTREALRGTGIHCPHPARYLDTIIAYSQEKNWGRRLHEAA